MTHSRPDSSPKNSEERKSSSTTLVQSVITGSVAGATEVLIDHPLWTIKTRMQCGEPFTFNPSLLYRGILPNAASMVPITALQVSLNKGYQNVFFKNSSELTNSQKITSAFVAGVGSAFVSCPTEYVMTHQGKNGGSFYFTGKQLVAQGGYRALYTGLGATALREGKFTMSFLGVTPILKSMLVPYCANDSMATLFAGMGSGVGATLASQGFDTIKAMQQKANPLAPVSFKTAAKNLYTEHGVYGFFKGGVPRGVRVMSAVTIMSWVTEKMDAKFKKG